MCNVSSLLLSLDASVQASLFKGTFLIRLSNLMLVFRFQPMKSWLAYQFFAFRCPPGHMIRVNGTKKSCVYTLCATRPCHRGTCVAQSPSKFTCHCPEGYRGRHCETTLAIYRDDVGLSFSSLFAICICFMALLGSYFVHCMLHVEFWRDKWPKTPFFVFVWTCDCVLSLWFVGVIYASWNNSCDLLPQYKPCPLYSQCRFQPEWHFKPLKPPKKETVTLQCRQNLNNT